MSPEEYDELIAILDGRIDELTRAVPSQQLLRFSEVIAGTSAEAIADYTVEDFRNPSPEPWRSGTKA